MLPIKNHENRLLVSSFLYQRVMVYNPAGMKPASQKLHYVSRGATRMPSALTPEGVE